MSVGGAIPEGDKNTWMPEVWGYLLVRYQIGSLIDIGCGYGHCLQWWNDMGIRGLGVEGWDLAIKGTVFKGELKQHDFTTGPYVHGTPFDLAWSAEFVEHLEEKFLPNVAPCFRAARYAVITHGEPEQAGFHHVNCKSDSYWIAQFKAWGFNHRVDETDLLRRTDRWRAPWGRRSLMFFERV